MLVEDDHALRIGLVDTFRDEGLDVTAAADGDEAHALLFSRHFDLVVLDLMLPGRSGLELLRALRAERIETPVLLLTARGDESDKVLGLELGADDYVTKPFGMRELIARVRVLLRRHGKAGTAADHAQVFRVGDARVDLGAFEVERDGETTRLSPKEAAMLQLLFANRGVAVRRERFLDEVWGTDQFVGNRTVDTHVLNLRQKLEEDPREPRHLLTVHGVGYRLDLGS
ncbi:MAG: response regulator transcription factor [Planctomycetes bacterium]|nr:response regulator transcription factor [Planctomycetota bacterium]